MQQEILARNGENQRKRQKASQLEERAKQLYSRVVELSAQLEAARKEHLAMLADLGTAKKTAEHLQDESTAVLEASIATIDEINRKVRANLDKEKAEEDAREYRRQYEKLTEQIERTRDEKLKLLDAADLPLPELSVKESELIYKGQKWDDISESGWLTAGSMLCLLPTHR